ncbi:hypothetical protein [Flavobacterium sp.]|uniref:hypothetical protein n=1 Tax=Flavobacterium sp. TaxID=239 RepID=UPI00374DBF43
MEKQNHNEYGQTDPDFIDQNTTVDGNNIHNDDLFKKETSKDNPLEFGESDPDYVDQETPVDNDNYAREEDPYQYQEEFVEDLKHPQGDAANSTNVKSDQGAKQEKSINKDDEK